MRRRNSRIPWKCIEGGGRRKREGIGGEEEEGRVRDGRVYERGEGRGERVGIGDR